MGRREAMHRETGDELAGAECSLPLQWHTYPWGPPFLADLREGLIIPRLTD